MKQPVAKISKDDIERIIRRGYSMYNKEEIFKILNNYKADNEKGTYRVWASLLKISKGNIYELNKNIESVQTDYRDIIAIAEYPNYTQKVGFNSEKFDKIELKMIIDSDWQQYQRWLKGWE